MSPIRCLFGATFVATVAALVFINAQAASSPAQGNDDARATSPQSCERLASLTLPKATITIAETVAAGAFKPSAAAAGPGPAGAQVFSTLAAFCRVAATLKPTSDSDIKIEVWLPAAGWNGKFQAVGNGGWAGTIPYPAMGTALRAGYATAGTDTGHTGNGAEFAIGHPEKLIDFGYRAIHEMTVQSKTIVNRFYENAPNLSYFVGCSLGGRQAITEAQRYPADFNGIVAGASAWNAMRNHAVRVALNLVMNREAGSYIPAGKYPMIHDAVLKACDARDGVTDRVIEDPTRCDFNYASLACTGADGPQCLTAPQVQSAQALLSPLKNPKSGAEEFPAYLFPGSELGWGTLGGERPYGNAATGVQNILFKDPKWDYHTFDLAADIERAATADKGVLYSGDANLTPFFERGGKLLMYHGWADPQVTPQASLIYYRNVLKTVGEKKAGDSVQLFMVPGMNHCQGGDGTDTFDKAAAIDQWVAQRRKPAQIVASHMRNGQADRTRPLCPYPQAAEYKGTGSTDDAANFICRAR